ncbi:class I SAM-dependent methyltransferase [Colwellia sp. 4_MG-2023]|uniref:class I SAM-dependent methyltransferase n=1 Tax=unclassified Colwellia TaxID=196834 RepID=UPI0026E4840E|nr:MULTISPECIES: class I SAM-dependent methyltransferase [unclassified Colwellia]MDO6506910.1 class I SAM-dependent methyltransferase [Colwellia sp. 5_MG-2023]MDO6556652.1 class I SAM-dependent methyltransferase [Colwellia sp. 4_MG-2023]
MQHWSTYWSSTKSLNSFAEGEHKQGYVGVIADYWHNKFQQLPSSAKILDIATGNGGLAVLAKEFNPHFTVYGSDAAVINPLSKFTSSDSVYNTLKNIKFYGDMPSEKLAFKDQEFDAVISQFGFEYAAQNAAILEVNRILKPNGSFIALIHHESSFITDDCKVGINIINRLSANNGLLDGLQDFANLCETIKDKNNPTLAQQTQFQKKNKDLLTLFKELQGACNDQAQLDWFNLLAKELVPVIMNWKHIDRESVATIVANTLFFRKRLEDQVDAAFSILDVNQIEATAKNHFNSFNVTLIEHDLGKLCWAIQATKNKDM